MTALDYLLKANLYGLLFVGCYWLLLHRHTFFSLNRLYLLMSAVLSLVLPLVSLPAQTAETVASARLGVPVGIISLPGAIVTATTATRTVVPASAPNWEWVAYVTYGLIATGFLIRLLIRLASLSRLIHQSPRLLCDTHVLVLPGSPTVPTFSFFRYLVLSPADADNQLIIEHELVHIRQWHSADVLGIALLRSLFWACPALWLVERALREVHEFLADAANQQPSHYAQFLFKYAFGVQPDPLTNSFFYPSLLKQRILRLHQQATSRWALSKYALVFPLASVLLAMTTSLENRHMVLAQTTPKTTTVLGRVTSQTDGKPLPGAIVTIANTGKGVPTDAQGRYKLNGVAGSAVLAFSFVGFQLVTEPVGNRTLINVSLTPEKASDLPPMGATAMYRAIRPNPKMPVRVPPTTETINGKTYTAVEEPAVFPTGVPGLMQYVAHALRYPAKAKIAGIEGDVYVQFTILPSGAVSNVKISPAQKRLGGGCEEEAIRVVSQMPKWLPGQQNGKPVAVQYQLPIRFTLEKGGNRTGFVKPALFKPTNSPVGDFPTLRTSTYPHQPRLSTITIPVPAGSFHLDTLPDSGPAIRIRTPDFSSKKPLFVVDGRVIPNDSLSARVHPNNIESVTVLKNSAATAIYGEKGKDGVILITTKKP